MTGVLILFFVFLLLCAATRGLYLRERRAAMRMEMALLRGGMDAVKADLAEAGELYRRAREDEKRPDLGIGPCRADGGIGNV